METPCLCPSKGHKHGGRVLLLKRKIIALELQHIEKVFLLVQALPS